MQIARSFRAAVFQLAFLLLLTACGGVDGTGAIPPTVASATNPGTTPSQDTTQPSITITAPTTGASYSTTSVAVTVTGTATDNVGLSQISWTNSKGGSGTLSVNGASASGSFNVALVSGSNVITMTARDAAGNSAQKKLTVTYTLATSNSALLTWDPPVSSTNVSGYRVYYGTAPGTYQQSFGQGISIGKVDTYTVMGLSNGTRYYFAVTAVDASGNESAYSNEAFKDIP